MASSEFAFVSYVSKAVADVVCDKVGRHVKNERSVDQVLRVPRRSVTTHSCLRNEQTMGTSLIKRRFSKIPCAV